MREFNLHTTNSDSAPLCEKQDSNQPSLEDLSQNNPYLQSRMLWNDMYGSIQDKLQNTYRIVFVLACVIVLAIIGLIIVAGQSKVKPYIALLHGNEIVTVSNFDTPETKAFKPKLASLLVQQFINDARNTSIDSGVNHDNSIAGYAFASGGVAKSLKDFIGVDSVEADQTRRCVFKTFLLKSSHTLEVQWDEEVRDNKSSQLLRTQSFSAEVTFQFDRVSNDPVIAQRNPLGFYITSFVWSKDLVNGR